MSKFTGITTYRNEPTKILKRTSMRTETDRNRLPLTLKRSSTGTRKGGVEYNPNKSMYIYVGMYEL